MRKRIYNLTERPFVRNVTVVAGGAAASQAITMVFSPIITRLYGPEAYGIQGIFMAVVGIMSTVAALSYPIAIVLPRSDADAVGLGRLSIIVGIMMSLLAMLLLHFFGGEFLTALNANEIAGFIYLMPVAMLVSVVGSAMGQWLIRKKAFELTSKVGVLVALLINSTKTGLGFIYPTALALIFVNMLSGALSAALMFLGWRKSRPNQQENSSSVKDLSRSTWALAKRHRDFALLRTPQNLINAISHGLPVMMLATYFGPAPVGFYTIAFSVLGIPSALIGNSVMQVFYPRINEAIHAEEDARSLIIKATQGLATMGALPFMAVVLAGPALFEFVFGAEWRTAGVYAQWLSVWLFFQYVNKPAVAAIPALGLQGGLLIYEIISTGTKVLALYIGYFVYESDITAIALFSIFGVIAYAWLIFWVIQHSGKAVKISENGVST